MGPAEEHDTSRLATSLGTGTSTSTADRAKGKYNMSSPTTATPLRTAAADLATWRSSSWMQAQSTRRRVHHHLVWAGNLLMLLMVVDSMFQSSSTREVSADITNCTLCGRRTTYCGQARDCFCALHCTTTINAMFALCREFVRHRIEMWDWMRNCRVSRRRHYLWARQSVWGLLWLTQFTILYYYFCVIYSCRSWNKGNHTL